MKKIKIVISDKIYENLKKALEWDGRERAAYMLCHSTIYKQQVKLLPYKVIIPEEKDYVHRSAGYYKVDKPFVNKLVNSAVNSQTHIIQCHIHPDNPGIFSSVDEQKEPPFMRHIAENVEGIYHGSMVFGNAMDTIDGWFYDRDTDSVIPIEKVIVIGKTQMKVIIPHGSPLKGVKISPCLDRTVKAFGKDAVKMLSFLDFGIVGASALGAPILKFLARDNVQSIFICDPDVITETNLNRLPVTTLSDIGKPKVEFYAEHINRISSKVSVKAFQNSFYEEKVQEAYAHADIIFGCVDSGARLSINRLCMANLIPYFDLGATIRLENGKPSFVGGQVFSIIPGRKACLSCTGVFDNLLQEFNSPDEQKQNRLQGYLNDGDTDAPLVHFLDNIICGFGYSQMLRYIWGTDEKEIFSAKCSIFQDKIVVYECQDTGCINCEPTGYLGKGDKAPFMIPKENYEIDFSKIHIDRIDNQN